MTRSALTSHRPALAILALVLCIATPHLSEARPVRVYEVDVAGQSQSALQEAMRQALVRATGHREAANDPALSPIVEGAQTYVKGYTKGAQGHTQVIFDGPAVERALAAAGHGVWSSDRPFTLVTLYPAPARGTEDAVRSELEQEASRRGLPITLVPIPVVDAGGKEIPGETMLQTGQRYGADQVLVGRQEGAQWRWSLHSNLSSPSWSGPLTAGVDGTVDTLAPPLGAVAGGAGEGDTRIQVLGINGLTDYVSLERQLQSIPGVRHVRIAEAQGTQVTFDLSVRGGADALDKALAGQTKLAKAPGPGGSLVYQYRP
jgi:hypothetical protein